MILDYMIEFYFPKNHSPIQMFRFKAKKDGLLKDWLHKFR